MRRKKIQSNYFFISLIFVGSFFLLFSEVSRADECDVLAGDEKEKCEDLQVKIDEYKSIIKRKEQKIEDLQKLIDEINSQQVQVETNIKKAKMQLMNLNEQIIFLEGEIEDKQKLIIYQKNILSGLMQNYYENYQQGELEAIVASENLASLFTQADYAGQTTFKLGEILKDIKNNKEELEEEKKEVEKKKEESENVKIKLEQENLNLQRTENQKMTLLGETKADKEKYEQLLADVQSEIYGLEAGLSEKVDLSSLPPVKGEYFTYPVNPHPISQKYGKTSFSYHYPTGLHNGVDFAISYKKVYAARDGKVLATGNNGRYAYGKWIAIDHGDGLVTLYGHLSSQSVSKGDKVEEGETIGISGNTGFSTGPHLHFSVFVKKTFDIVESTKVNGLMLPVGATVDPMRYL